PARSNAKGATRSHGIFRGRTCSRGRTGSRGGGSSGCRRAGSDYREKGRGRTCCCCEGKGSKGEGAEEVVHFRFSILDFGLRDGGRKTNSVGRRSRKPRHRIRGHASQYRLHGG